MERDPITADEYATVTLDITTLTLAEAAAAEAASGLVMRQLARGVNLRILAMFVHELRTSDAPRSWSELSSLRLLDVSSSILRSAQAGASQTSND